MDANWYPKREARKFEPPPWERAQFDELQQRQAEAEEAARVAEAAAADTAPEDVAAGILPAETSVEAAVPAMTEPAGQQVAASAPKAAPKPLPIPEAQVDAMLLQLGSDEPKVDEHLKIVGVFSSAIAMLIGVSLFAWGVYAMITASGTIAGAVGAMIVLGMGLVIGLTGFWLGWRVTNRQGDQ
jgi:hypothetical protein